MVPNYFNCRTFINKCNEDVISDSIKEIMLEYFLNNKESR
jgi:hypothetical protein